MAKRKPRKAVAKARVGPSRPGVVKFERRAFRIGTTALRGVRPVIQSTFYPEYDFGKAVYGPSAANLKRTYRVNGNPTTRGRTACEGAKIGAKVDKEISRIINLMVAHDLTIEEVIDRKQLLKKKYLLEATVEGRWLVRKSQLLHPLTNQFLKIMNIMKWIPIGAQIACGSKFLRMGTAVDVVVASPKDPSKHILIEIKCGFREYMHKYNSPMRFPLQHLTNCPMNQFLVQLQVSQFLYREHFRLSYVPEGFVIVLHEGGFNSRQLSKCGLSDVQVQKKMWQELARTTNQNAKQRLAYIKKCQNNVLL